MGGHVIAAELFRQFLKAVGPLLGSPKFLLKSGDFSYETKSGDFHLQHEVWRLQLLNEDDGYQ